MILGHNFWVNYTSVWWTDIQTQRNTPPIAKLRSSIDGHNQQTCWTFTYRNANSVSKLSVKAGVKKSVETLSAFQCREQWQAVTLPRCSKWAGAVRLTATNGGTSSVECRRGGWTERRRRREPTSATSWVSALSPQHHVDRHWQTRRQRTESVVAFVAVTTSVTV